MSVDLSVLERPGGGFAMLALDQRESMRDLLGPTATDDELRAFKADAARILAPDASAILLDRVYGVTERPAWIGSTPLILAVDVFTQPPGAPVQRSELDLEATPELIASLGASALKFLALWRRDDDLGARTALVESFVELARRAGVLAVLEGIVRPSGDATGWRSTAERDDAIVEAAAEFAGLGPDLYKAEVPGDPLDPASIEAGAARITAVVPCPWVVLSNGVPPDAFPAAVEAACRGGASGFLAGRAVWAPSAGVADRAGMLATDAAGRLRAMSGRVSVPA